MAATQFRTRTPSNPPPPPDENDPEDEGQPQVAKKTGKNDTSPVFWELISSLTEDDWTNHICYWYRLAPKIDRSTSGRGLSIKTTAHAFTLDTVMKEEGSGGYRFDLLKRDPKTGKSGLVHRHYDQILNLTYPPRVPYGPWINESENSLWKWAEEPLKLKEAQSQARVDAIENGPTTAADPSQIFTTILEGVKTLRPEAGENAGGIAGQLLKMVMDNQQAMAAVNDPAKQLATLKTLMDSLKPEPVKNDAATMMLDFMREQTAALREEIKEMRQAANAPRKSLGEELRELTGIFTEIAPNLGYRKAGDRGTPNPGTNGTDWAGVINNVLDKGQVFAPMIMAAIQRNGAPPPQTPGWTPQPQIPAPQQQANPQPQPHTGEPQPTMPEMTPEQKEQADQQAAKMQAFWTKHQQIITQCVPFVLDKFTTENGYEFREWFIHRQGAYLWTALKEDGGPEILTALAVNHPQLRFVLKPPERVAEFFTEFFTEQGQEAQWWKDQEVPEEDDHAA